MLRTTLATSQQVTANFAMHSAMRTPSWTYVAVVTLVAAVLVSEGVSAAPSKQSVALARRLAPVLRHRLEGAGGGGHVSPALMEEIVADFEDPEQMDFYDADKRQFDEYGHMRFGKRGGVDYDDYGHLRFGRSLGHSRQTPKHH